MENKLNFKKPWEFDIQRIPLDDVSGLREIRGVERDVLLINKDDNSRLGIVSPQYSILSHKECVDGTLEAIGEISKIDGRFLNYKISDRPVLRKNKAYFKLDITFPEILFNVGNIGLNDLVNFGISIENGIDGFTKFSCSIYGYRLICTNGLTVKKSYRNISMKHMGFAIPKFKDVILNQLKSFEHVVNEWKFLSNRKISDQEIQNLFLQVKVKAKEQNISEKHINKIEESAISILNEEGSSLFTFWNLATSYTTKDYDFTNMENVVQRTNGINNLFYDVVMESVA